MRTYRSLTRRHNLAGRIFVEIESGIRHKVVGSLFLLHLLISHSTVEVQVDIIIHHWVIFDCNVVIREPISTRILVSAV